MVPCSKPYHLVSEPSLPDSTSYTSFLEDYIPMSQHQPLVQFASNIGKTLAAAWQMSGGSNIELQLANCRCAAMMTSAVTLRSQPAR